MSQQRLDLDDVGFAGCVGGVIGLASSMVADGMGLPATKVFLYTLGFTAFSFMAISFWLVISRKVRK